MAKLDNEFRQDQRNKAQQATTAQTKLKASALRLDIAYHHTDATNKKQQRQWRQFQRVAATNSGLMSIHHRASVAGSFMCALAPFRCQRQP